MLSPLILVATYGRKKFQVSRFPQFNKHRVNFAIFVLIVAVALQLAILFDALPNSQGTLFFSGLVCVLLVGVIQFFAALVHARRDSSDA